MPKDFTNAELKALFTKDGYFSDPKYDPYQNDYLGLFQDGWPVLPVKSYVAHLVLNGKVLSHSDATRLYMACEFCEGTSQHAPIEMWR